MYKNKYLKYKQIIGGSEFNDLSYIIFYKIILKNKLTDEIIQEA
jgi:hypothetical protein